jgi:NAD(P)-dependent dehydrogenase (short-subunit alcohol dehydrogenase family)
MSRQPIDFDFPLRGKTALITGAASGIGGAVVEAFAKKGVHIALVDLNETAAKAKAASLPAADAFACNVSDPEQVEATVAAVERAFGRIDILVNSAGIAELAPAEELSVAAWRRTIDVNLTGSFLMTQAVGRRMIAAGGGKIINLASQAGSVAIEGHVAYCASKFAVIGMSKTFALEWGSTA